jgi:hypothetical protein
MDHYQLRAHITIQLTVMVIPAGGILPSGNKPLAALILAFALTADCLRFIDVGSKIATFIYSIVMILPNFLPLNREY